MTVTTRGLVLWAAALFGCPGGSSEDSSSGTGEASGTSAPTGSSGVTEGEGTTAGSMCEDPSNVGIGPGVAVHLRNDGAADVFVRAPSSCEGTPYQLIGAGEEVLQIELGSCPPPCADVLANLECGCPDGICATSVIRIVPGGIFDGAWSGALVSAVTLPDACLPEACAGTGCAIETQAPDGMYKFVATHSKSIACGVPDCMCEPSAMGWCEINTEASLGAEEPPAEAGFVYPASLDVTVVFE